MVSGLRMLLDKLKGFTLFPEFRRPHWNKRLATRHLSSPDKVMDYLHKCGIHVKTVTMVMPKKTGTGYSENCDITLQMYAKYAQDQTSRHILEKYCGIAIEE